MKIIEPSVEILTPINGIEVLKTLELAGRTCYIKGTEILTSRGFLPVENIKTTDDVFVFNPKNMTLSYEPSNMISKPYSGEIINIKHREVEVSVTPDHRMYLGKIADKEYRFIQAKEMLYKKGNQKTIWRIPKYFRNVKRDVNELRITVEYEKIVRHGCIEPTTERIAFELSDDLLVLIGAYITEGYGFHGEKSGSGSHISVCQSQDSELYNMIITSLKNLNIKFNINTDPRKTNVKHIIFGNSVYVAMFESLCGRYSENKHLPEWFRDLSDRQLQLLLNVLYLGDGSHNTSRTERYISISERLINEVQEAHILLGSVATKSYNKQKSQYCFTSECKRDSWLIRHNHIKKAEYSGVVYCPSTNAGVVCVRNNGKVFWCGNCYKSEDKITEDSCIKFVQNVLKRGHEAVIEHYNITVRFICDRGVTHEIVRHRLASYCQESTRYVSYSKKAREIKTKDDVLFAYCNAGMSMKKISEKSNGAYTEWDVYKILEEKDIQKRNFGSRGTIDETYFDVIDTPEKAFLLGFIMADGSVRRDLSQITISQKEDESWWILNMIRDFIQPDAKSLSIHNSHICQSLVSKGIIPNKTYDFGLKECELLWNSVPYEYKYDFLRGMLDGDGSIRWFYQKDSSKSMSCNIAFNGAETMIKCISAFIESDLGYKGNVRQDSISDYLYRYTITNAIYGKMLCEKLYKHFMFPYGHSKTTRYYDAFEIKIPIKTSAIADKDFNVIAPCFSGTSLWIWGRGMVKSEIAYKDMIENGATPQEARSVLPNSLKTELVMTANIREWRHFLKLRTSKAAHPQMREVAIMLLKQLKSIPVLFDDITV